MYNFPIIISIITECEIYFSTFVNCYLQIPNFFLFLHKRYKILYIAQECIFDETLL